MMQWFGQAGGAPYEADSPHVDTPVGEPCAWCDEPIAAGDDGVIEWGMTKLPYHYECRMRRIVGGFNHLLKRCHCCGGKEPPDPPEYSARHAAVLAWRTYQAMEYERHFREREEGGDE